jgi:hypothetical protein
MPYSVDRRPPVEHVGRDLVPMSKAELRFDRFPCPGFELVYPFGLEVDTQGTLAFVVLQPVMGIA